jgi:5-methylcytosine-specific restriction endonuclease McrA
MPGKYLTLETIKKRIKIINPNIKILSIEYKGCRKKLDLKCLIDGYLWSTTWHLLNRNHGCPKCKNNLKLTIEEVKPEFTKRGLIPLFNDYKNIDEKLLGKTKEGYKGLITLHHLKRGIKISPFSKANPYVLDNIRLWLEANNKPFEILSVEYNGANSKLKCRCKTHNEIWFPTWANLSQGHNCPKCGLHNVTGINSTNYNHDKSDEERELGRNYSGNKLNKWRKAVFERDNYTCQCCGDDKGGNLAAHHIDGYNWCKEKRFDVNNGVTLCEDCHKKFHAIYRKGNNTSFQYYKFINLYRLRRQINVNK